MNIKILAYNIPNNKISNLKNNDFVIDKNFFKQIENYLKQNQIN